MLKYASVVAPLTSKPELAPSVQYGAKPKTSWGRRGGSLASDGGAATGGAVAAGSGGGGLVGAPLMCDIVEVFTRSFGRCSATAAWLLPTATVRAAEPCRPMPAPRATAVA